MGAEVSGETPLHQLQQLVSEQKTIMLPKENLEDPDLIEAQVRVERYDRLVTSIVSQVITGQDVDVVAAMYDPDLDSELSALHQVKEGRAMQIVEHYRHYKVRLDKMLGLAVQIARERKPRRELR